MESIEIPLLSDMHVHLRQGDMLKQVARYTDNFCGYALVMPNTDPPIINKAALADYKAHVNAVLPNCEPLFTFKLTRNLNLDDVVAMQKMGAVAGKLYPKGLTTNSDDGWDEYELQPHAILPAKLAEALSLMEAQDLVLCVHAEMPGVFCLDREREMLDWLFRIYADFPKLRIVIEHVSTQEAVNFVKDLNSPRLAATITAHHLVLTLDDVIGGKLSPHNFCKPVAKRPMDRTYLRRAAMGLYGPRFFLGSDSAPHEASQKHCHGCAGCFTAPVLPRLLAQVFDEGSRLDQLPFFGTHFGNIFYRQAERPGRLRLTRQKTKVLPIDGTPNVVPFMLLQDLDWHVERIA